jgi:hypothetical protein
MPSRAGDRRPPAAALSAEHHSIPYRGLADNAVQPDAIAGPGREPRLKQPLAPATEPAERASADYSPLEGSGFQAGHA